MKQIITSLAIVLFLSSCSKQENPSFVDNSYTPSEAIEFGAPSINRDWNAPEYDQFVQYLNTIPNDIALPKGDSEFSGELFDKSIDSMDMSLLSNDGLDIGIRLSASAQQMNAVNTIVKKYLNAHLEGNQDYSTEISYYLGSVLLVTRNTLELIDEFVPSLDKNDPSYSTRMDGLKMVNGGAITAFNGYILSITKDTIYDDAEYDIFALYLENHGAFFIDRFEGDVKREFEFKLDEMSKNHQNTNIRNAAGSIINRQPELGAYRDNAR